MTSGSSANRARRRRRCLATFIIFVTRFPRLPPGTTYLLPCGKPLRHPVTHLCYRPESNIGEHPRSPRRLRERDAMKQYQMDCGPLGLPPSLPSPPLAVEAVTVFLVLRFACCTTQVTPFQDYAKTLILHSFYDPLSGIV